MAKVGGIDTIVRLFRQKHRAEGWTFMSPDTISTETGISVDRVKRILNRPSNASMIRRNRGDREIYTLLQF